MSMRACIVVPVFNQAAGACSLVEQLRAYGLETILVNDGSDPGQAEQLRATAREHAWIQIVEHRKNQGKGAAVKSALRAAHARGFTHALQIDRKSTRLNSSH